MGKTFTITLTEDQLILLNSTLSEARYQNSIQGYSKTAQKIAELRWEIETQASQVPVINIYQQKGYKNRGDYLKYLAETYEVSLKTVLTIASMLGKNEDFDGLVSALEDLEDYE